MGDYHIASANHSVDEADNMAFVDGGRSELFARVGGSLQGEEARAISANRQVFRDWIIQRLDLKLGKRLSHYTESEEAVTAFFTDGTSARGSLLVGADGANSVVRNSLLDNPKPVLHTFVPICGDVVFRGKALQQIRTIANSAVISYSSTAHLILQQLEISPDGTEARWWWVMAFKSDDPVADTAWVQSASKESLYKKALATSHHMPEVLTDAIRRGGPSEIWTQQIRFSEYVPPTKLPRGRVTLMGDAAHSTTPFGGMGANISIRDSCDLGRLLSSEKWDSYGELETLLRRYEEIMLPRGRNLVLLSRARGFWEPGKLPVHADRRAKVQQIQPPISLDEILGTQTLVGGETAML